MTARGIDPLDRGSYAARRAAALSGVPLRTLHRWAESGLVVPSGLVSGERRWSYGDLLTLRLVRWLRTEHPESARAPLHDVRAALAEVGDDLWHGDDAGTAPSIRVSRSGDVVLVDGPLRRADGQLLLGGEQLDLLAPWSTGPDLRRPRPHLLLLPGYVGGEPHVAGTRVTTRSVAALVARAGDDAVVALHPDLPPAALAEAVDLERALAGVAG